MSCCLHRRACVCSMALTHTPPHAGHGRLQGRPAPRHLVKPSDAPRVGTALNDPAAAQRAGDAVVAYASKPQGRRRGTAAGGARGTCGRARVFLALRVGWCQPGPVSTARGGAGPSCAFGRGHRPTTAPGLRNRVTIASTPCPSSLDEDGALLGVRPRRRRSGGCDALDERRLPAPLRRGGATTTRDAAPIDAAFGGGGAERHGRRLARQRRTSWGWSATNSTRSRPSVLGARRRAVDDLQERAIHGHRASRRLRVQGDAQQPGAWRKLAPWCYTGSTSLQRCGSPGRGRADDDVMGALDEAELAVLVAVLAAERALGGLDRLLGARVEVLRVALGLLEEDLAELAAQHAERSVDVHRAAARVEERLAICWSPSSFSSSAATS